MVKSTGEQIAVKVVTLDKDDPGSMSHLEALDNELEILQELDHPRIVRYLGHERIAAVSDREGEKMVIFCEYLPGGSVAGALRQFGPFEEDQIAQTIKQMLEGLKYLHESRVVHRDIKCANALMDLHGNVRLADFGCSKKLQVTSTMALAVPASATVPEGGGLTKTLKGSVPWMAPEVILGEGYGRAADIWALGCCVVEMATGKHPWAGKLDNVLQAMYRIAMLEENIEIPDKLSSVCKDFVAKCTKRDPKLRPNANELLLHPWLTAIAPFRGY
jgi:serine/threonine protein kinase